MINLRFVAFLLFLLIVGRVSGQKSEKQLYRIVCYNVENFFDTKDDSTTNDSEYLPGGIRGWNYERYQTKQAHIAKVIASIGGWDNPPLVGLCEVESERCLRDLTRYSGLKNMGYRYLHHESPDPRGVDVALLYQPSMFKPLSDQVIRIAFADRPDLKTRDILYVRGLVPSGDTLQVFVCHFPSRLAGELESEDKRLDVARTLRLKLDSVFTANTLPNIVIMGDFNDYPTNRSIAEVLGALPPTGTIVGGNLYNLTYPLHVGGKGSHKHDGEWGALDQIIVSGNLLNTAGRFYTVPGDVHFFDAAFLLENDDAHLGKQPFRTYVGMKYHGGYSDHLPVYADFWY